jgi:hypothetical protein
MMFVYFTVSIFMPISSTSVVAVELWHTKYLAEEELRDLYVYDAVAFHNQTQQHVFPYFISINCLVSTNTPTKEAVWIFSSDDALLAKRHST